MFFRYIRVLAWLVLMAGISTLGYVGYSYFTGELEVSSRAYGTSIIKLVDTPGSFYCFLLAYLFSALLMLGLAYYILVNK